MKVVSEEPCRVLFIICLGIHLLFLPGQIYGQDTETNRRPLLVSILSNSRMEISPSYLYISETGTHETALRLGRTIPMGIDRSSLSVQSRVSLIHAALGVRMTGEEEMNQELRWSAGLLEADLYRAPIAVGITVLHYDRLGTFDLDARWLNVRLGPSFRLESEWGAVEPRLVGSIGGSSFRPGTVNFPSFDDRARGTIHGFDTSYRVELAARLNYWLLFSVSAGQRVLVGYRNVHVDQAQLEVQTIPLPKLQIFAQYRLERLAIQDRSDILRRARMGLRIWL